MATDGSPSVVSQSWLRRPTEEDVCAHVPVAAFRGFGLPLPAIDDCGPVLRSRIRGTGLSQQKDIVEDVAPTTSGVLEDERCGIDKMLAVLWSRQLRFTTAATQIVYVPKAGAPQQRQLLLHSVTPICTPSRFGTVSEHRTSRGTRTSSPPSPSTKTR